jgi:cyclopropane fatty-acyl-phospholipid synthase-like methyltransferase
MQAEIERNAQTVRQHYNRFFEILDRSKSIPKGGWDQRPPIVNLGYWSHGARTARDAQVAFVHELASRVTPLDGRPVLDVGCGLCGPATILASDYGAQVDAVNINDQQVAWARQFIEGNHLQDRVRVHVGNAMALAFPDETFDVVFCLEAAHCFTDKGRFLGQVRRVLRPEGKLVMADITSTTRLPLLRWLPALKLNLLTAPDWHSLVQRSGFLLEHEELVGKAVYPGYRRWLKESAGERRNTIFHKICPVSAAQPVRCAKHVQAWAQELLLCRSFLRMFSWLGLREYVLLVARKRGATLAP